MTFVFRDFGSPIAVGAVLMWHSATAAGDSYFRPDGAVRLGSGTWCWPVCFRTMKHLGIEHPRRPRRRVCCKFGSVLYLLGSHWFSPFEDIDVQRKFLSCWRICLLQLPVGVPQNPEKTGAIWKDIKGELPAGWIKQSFRTAWQSLSNCITSVSLTMVLNKTSAGAVQSYNVPWESSCGVSIFLDMWWKSSLHLSRVCNSHQTSWREQFSLAPT